MKIALDYDGTYTEDPSLWNVFIQHALSCGHEIVCVTMRFPDEAIQMPCPVVYTSRKAKAEFYQADVWIDDNPRWLFVDAAA